MCFVADRPGRGDLAGLGLGGLSGHRLEGCARILRPGSVALFFEPMQGANWMVRSFYAAVLAHQRAPELPTDLQRYLRNRIRFFDDRVCTDKDQPKFLKMDDKWMFTREYFHDIAER